jgi:hypothetical protein
VAESAEANMNHAALPDHNDTEDQACSIKVIPDYVRTSAIVLAAFIMDSA